jgi:outer membrane protein assembly factor BamD
MRKALVLFVPILLLVIGCSDFNKAMKAKGDVEGTKLKMRVAEKLYAEGDHDRTLPLLEELLSLTRGDTAFERVTYLYAMSNFGLKDYVLAGYYLENFAKTFPASRYAEQSMFLSAFCHFKQSPEFELDQTDTRSAIDQMELFMVRFPDSQLKDSCNTIIDVMRAKLEKKDYFNAKLYLKVREYAAAAIAFNEFLKRWPNSPYREDVLFSTLVAYHDLARNSIDMKKITRVEDGMRAFVAYSDAYPDTMRFDEAQRLRDDLVDIRERALFNNIINERDLALSSRGKEKNEHLDAGTRYFDTFARDFPQSPRLKEAERLRDELQDLRERLTRPANP